MTLPQIVHPLPYIQSYNHVVVDGNNCQLSNGTCLPTIRLEATILILDSVFHGVYYHWLFDVIPKLLLLIQEEIAFDAILIPTLNREFQMEILRIFGGTIPIISTQNERILVRRAIFVSKLTSGITPLPWALSVLSKALVAVTPTKAHEKIYISRDRATNRRVINELELFDILAYHGFEVIYLEELSVIDQITLFSVVKSIIAPHGSGLSNIIFSKMKPKILELTGPRCGETCFVRLAHFVNAPYLAMQCPENRHTNALNRLTSMASDSFNKWDYHVDPVQFERVLTSYFNE